MSFRTRAIATAASLTLLGSAATGLFTSGVANAATPSCGKACVDIFSDQFGDPTTGHPGFLMDSFKQGIATGTSIILFRESNSDPAEDFVFENQGTVADFFAAGLVGATTALHYGCLGGTSAFPDCVLSPENVAGNPTVIDPKTGKPVPKFSIDANLAAFEVEYAPFGAATGQCVGLAATPTSGEHVTLQPCGVSSKTVWIVDTLDSVRVNDVFGNGVPLINGANTNFSHPYVMTYPSSGYPTDKPRPVLFVSPLTGFFQGIFPTASTADLNVNSNQLWDALFGTVTI